MYQTHPDHVQLNSNILTHILHQAQQYAIQTIRTRVVPKDQPIHQLLSAKVLRAREGTITPQTEPPPVAVVLVTLFFPFF